MLENIVRLKSQWPALDLVDIASPVGRPFQPFILCILGGLSSARSGFLFGQIASTTRISALEIALSANVAPSPVNGWNGMADRGFSFDYTSRGRGCGYCGLGSAMKLRPTADGLNWAMRSPAAYEYTPAYSPWMGSRGRACGKSGQAPIAAFFGLDQWKPVTGSGDEREGFWSVK